MTYQPAPAKAITLRFESQKYEIQHIVQQYLYTLQSMSYLNNKNDLWWSLAGLSQHKSLIYIYMYTPPLKHFFNYS